MFYKAILERGRGNALTFKINFSLKLKTKDFYFLVVVTALVTLSRDFPSTPPLFCVQVEMNGDRRDSTNDPAIRVRS